MGPPRVPTYYNFAWVPHTFGGLTPPDPPLFRTLRIAGLGIRILSPEKQLAKTTLSCTDVQDVLFWYYNFEPDGVFIKSNHDSSVEHSDSRRVSDL